jgi:hypothetical protein
MGQPRTLAELPEAVDVAVGVDLTDERLDPGIRVGTPTAQADKCVRRTSRW